jgi:hypothetical protein
MAEYASKKPNNAPPSAVIRLILILIQYAPRIYGFLKSEIILSNVNAPFPDSRKLLLTIVDEG